MCCQPQVTRAPGSPGGEPQLWYGDAQSITLGHVAQGSEDSGGATVRIYTPDSRVRVKLSVFFVRDNGANSDPISATLYVGAEEFDRSGAGRGYVLVTDVLRAADGSVVHQSDPLEIPEDNGLDGFSYEFVSACDAVRVILASDEASAASSGHWVLQVRFQPDGQYIPPAEWEYIKRGFRATLLTGEFTLAP